MKSFWPHLLLILLIAGVLVLCIFLPYLPGQYDQFAMPLSFLAQLASFAGLGLVPIGLWWLILELSWQKQKLHQVKKRSMPFLIAAYLLGGFIILAVILSGLIAHMVALPIIFILVGIFYVMYARRIFRNSDSTGNHHFSWIPLYFICIPVLVITVRHFFIDQFNDNSRLLAIRNSELLIRDIEGYFQLNGSYPVSLHSVWEDYDPCVKGIDRYYYEQNGDAYNLFFEQISHRVGLREFVMYNKLDQHNFTSHNEDLLRLPLTELNRQRGYHAVHDVDIPHWKYFWFD